MIRWKRNLLLGLPSILFVDTFIRADGAIGGDWTGATWTISGNQVLNTPALGSELMVNGDMETGNPPTGWNVAGTSTLTGVADPRPGSAGIQSLNAARGTTDQVSNKSTASGQVEWHRFECWLKNVSGVDCYFVLLPSVGSTTGESRHETATSWNLDMLTMRLTAAAALTVRLQVTTTAAQQARFDDVSVKKITRASLFATVDKGVADVNLVAPALSAWRVGTQSGIVMCLDDATTPANFVIAYVNEQTGAVSPSIVIEQCVAGVYTVLATVVTALSLTKHFSAKKVGNQLSIYYGTTDFGTLVGGAAVTLNAALVNNTKHGMMSTVEVNTFSGTFTLARYS